MDDRPNVVVILADDLGYGDPSHLNPDSNIPTPRIDALADAGRSCTDAHSGSAVCTPTRYGLLTGRHCFRTRLTAGVLGGYDPPLIDADGPTLASRLSDVGYHTACIGKWHLGMEWTFEDGRTTSDVDLDWDAEEAFDIEFTDGAVGGPTDRGFDHFFGIAGSADMPPYVFIEDGVPVTDPTARLPEDWFGRSGPMDPDWTHDAILPTLTEHAVEYVEERGRARTEDGDPFFCYVPLNAPHTPIAPDDDARGRSDAGPYGDFVAQIDRCVGDVCDALDRTGIADDTLVIVTSDNGSPARARSDGEAAEVRSVVREYDHDPSGPWRGLKGDAWEGGHRVPFVVRWPGAVPAGTVCDATLSLNDLPATVASLIGIDPPADAIDSCDVSEALLTDGDGGGRTSVVHHALDGTLAMREGPWKYIDGADSGGFSRRIASTPEDAPDRQLYRIATDPGETINREAMRPDVADRLAERLDRIRGGAPDDGR